VLPSCCAAPLSTRGLHSLFRSGFCVKRPLPLLSTASPRLDSTPRRGALFLPVEGARNLLRFHVRCQLASSTLSSASSRFVARATSPFRGEAASTTAALGVNFARRLRISSFTSFVRGFRRQCDFAFPSEGRGFYHHRVGSQLRAANPYSLFQPDQEHPPPVRFRLPFEGARLLSPPRWESTRFFASLFPLVLPGARATRMSQQGRGIYLATGGLAQLGIASLRVPPRSNSVLFHLPSSRRENRCI
jgi:hypothetical protein